MNAVVYTHEHADHVFGLDDVRLFPYYLGHKLPLYCEKTVDERIRKLFDYAFAHEGANYAGGIPLLEMHSITRTVDLWVAASRRSGSGTGALEVLGFRFSAMSRIARIRTRFRTKAGHSWEVWTF